MMQLQQKSTKLVTEIYSDETTQQIAMVIYTAKHLPKVEKCRRSLLKSTSDNGKLRHRI